MTTGNHSWVCADGSKSLRTNRKAQRYCAKCGCIRNRNGKHYSYIFGDVLYNRIAPLCSQKYIDKSAVFPLNDFENSYKISMDGFIINAKNGRIIQYYTKGYARVRLALDGLKYKIFQVHRLVALQFIPNPNNYPCVNHKDGNKLNNHVDNLEWCTQQQNVQHYYKNKKQFIQSLNKK